MNIKYELNEEKIEGFTISVFHEFCKVKVIEILQKNGLITIYVE